MRAGAGDPLLVNNLGRAYTRTSLSEMVARLALKAGIKRIPVRAHTIRRSVGSLALKSGATVIELAKLLNHSDTSTALRYANAEASSVDAVRERVRGAMRS